MTPSMQDPEGADSRDTVEPKGSWVFDSEVALSFDDMLERSIPQYSVMRDAVTGLGCRFMDAVDGRATVIDLGCSRGAALAPFVERYGQTGRFYGVEVSEPMLDEARSLFTKPIKQGTVRLERLDLRTEWVDIDASEDYPNQLTLCVLTLQFIPMEHRQRLLTNAFDAMRSGGAFLLVEKVLGSSSSMDRLFVDAYYQSKRNHGYSQGSIDRKRLSLEGVLVPVTAQWNEELLRQAGFHQVDCFWRWMNFAGWVAVKP